MAHFISSEPSSDIEVMLPWVDQHIQSVLQSFFDDTSMLMFNTQGPSELSETHLTIDTYGNCAPVSYCTACSALLFWCLSD